MNYKFLCVLVMLVVALPCCAFCAPITFSTALPVAKGEAVLRLQAKYLRSTDDPSDLDRELRVWSTPIVGAFGISSRLALFGILSFVNKELELNTSEGRRTRTASGIGDTTFLARYTLWKRDGAGQTLRVAPFGGLKVPTGNHNKRDTLGQLPRTLQVGSGSWDGIAGSVLTWQTLSRQLDTSFSYKINTESDGYEFGDVARLDVSYQHRISPKTLRSGVPAFVYAVIESNLIWKAKDRINNKKDSNSGGLIWYITPGIQRVTRRTVIEGAIRIPVSQNLNGNALKNDFICILGFRINF